MSPERPAALDNIRCTRPLSRCKQLHNLRCEFGPLKRHDPHDTCWPRSLVLLPARPQPPELEGQLSRLQAASCTHRHTCSDEDRAKHNIKQLHEIEPDASVWIDLMMMSHDTVLLYVCIGTA